jgi:pSer/pThr/pTyr-binding forkhead associated (FHA) protein
VNHCAFCGRENDEQAMFCIDCGKPIVAGGAHMIPVAAVMSPDLTSPMSSPVTTDRASQPRVAQPRTGPADPAVHSAGGGRLMPCPGCGAMIDPALPYCAHCGTRVATSTEAPPQLARAASITPMGVAVRSGAAGASRPKLAVIDDAGTVLQTITLEWAETSIGRIEGNFRFPDDPYLSPMHAQFSFRDGQLFVRDLGSRNGTWLYIDAPYRLQDGDTMLIGSQILRFRRLGYPGPHPPEADRTRRLGSLTPTADVALLAQLRADGSARDTCHLSPGRSVRIGRDEGDWLFPFDQTMSARHAEIRGEDLEFIVIDDASRNGIAIAVRGEKPVKAGQKLLMGDQTLRVESL